MHTSGQFHLLAAHRGCHRLLVTALFSFMVRTNAKE